MVCPLYIKATHCFEGGCSEKFTPHLSGNKPLLTRKPLLTALCSWWLGWPPIVTPTREGEKTVGAFETCRGVCYSATLSDADSDYFFSGGEMSRIFTWPPSPLDQARRLPSGVKAT